MRLTVAGQDRSADLGASLTRQTARHQGALSRWAPEDSALSLKDSKDSTDYLARYCRLLHLRYALSTEAFPIHARPGPAGNLLRKVKTMLWKLLRYQHDRMAFQQNAINELVISGLAFQQARLAALEQQVNTLESELAASREKAARL